MLKGVDIYEGDNITDYDLLKQDGIEVIIQKATQSTEHIDSLLRYRYPIMKQKGFLVGFYHFASYNSTNPIGEAQHFLSTINGLKNDVLLFLDIEAEEHWGKLTAINYTNSFINYVQKQGFKIGIYTGASFYYDYLQGNIPNVPLWLASYGKTPTLYSQGIASWQYSESGKLNGVSGEIDLNNFQNNILINNQPQVVKKTASKYEETIPESIIYEQISKFPFYFEKRADGGFGIHLDRGNYLTMNQGVASVTVNDNNGFGDSKVLVDVKKEGIFAPKYDMSIPTGDNIYVIPNTSFYIEKRTDNGLSIHLDRGNYITFRKGECEIASNDNEGHYCCKSLVKAQSLSSIKYDENIPTGDSIYSILNSFYVEKRNDGGMSIHLDKGNYLTLSKGIFSITVNDNNGHANTKVILSVK